MKNIEIAIINPSSIEDAERMMVTAAKLTQRSHNIGDLGDFTKLYRSDFTTLTVERLAGLPHPTLQKLGIVNIVVIGLSRRALAQITRHQNEVKFVAGSLQYSDHSESVSYVIPPGVEEFREDIERAYEVAGAKYKKLIAAGVDRDLAGYVLPQGFRTSLLISATPYQIKHMISQRTCRRNTEEVRYIMLHIWKTLTEYFPELFENSGPFCTRGVCQEGSMSCKKPMTSNIEELIEEIRL